eukprot:COSAG05_NODE_786_length_7335_cov_1255.905058_2_plen_104_part_00
MATAGDTTGDTNGVDCCDGTDEEEWDAFVESRMPLPAATNIVPPGMTAGGLARRRASLAPQPVLPEIDHKIKQKALTVSGEMDAQTTLDDCGGAFMAAVEEDV